MNWSTAGDIKAQLVRRWERGELLRSLLEEEARFPLRLNLKCPSSPELTDRFQEVRAWVAALLAVPHIRIGWREVQHRVHGLQCLPESVWVDSLEDALALIGRRRDGELFAAQLVFTRSTRPALLPWLARRPLQALELAESWPRLLAVVAWIVAHPRPGIHLRQADIPGVHSKFIEAHRAVLSELFDLVLPPEAIASERSGAGQFSARYGFLDKPVRIRFRGLDERIRLLPGPRLPDLTLDADSFARLDVPLRHVFITENEINFLAFPPVKEAIVIFGAGYGWEALARADWLTRCTVHYWGDIDTHGFAILDQLRRHFAHVASFLMDHDTLMAHETQWGVETEQLTHDLPGLSGEESILFDVLRDNRIRQGLRLERERVGFEWVMAALRGVADGPLPKSPQGGQVCPT
jgi:hypothetical protein